jgi:chromosome segregation ATPase
MANQALKWAYKEFGKKNVLSAELHLDETTPHLHMMVLPETPEGRLSAKIVVGDRNRLSALQDSYAEALSPLGIDRGVKGSKAKHTSIRQYYTETSKIEEARKKREEAEHLREEIEQQVKTTMAMREQLREEVDELGVARGLLGGVKEQQEKDKEIRELRERERQLQDEVVKLKGEVASYQGQVVDSSEDIELK